MVFNLAENFGIPTVSGLDLPTGLPVPSWPFGSPEDMKVPFNLETLGIVRHSPGHFTGGADGNLPHPGHPG